MTPFVKIKKYPMFGFWDCLSKFVVGFAMPCIKSIITGHFKMFFRYVLYKQGNKVHYRNGFFHIGVVFVFVVMKGYVFAIIGINAGGGNNRAAKVTADVFYNSVGVTEIWFCIDIKPIFIFFVNGSFCFFERRTNTHFRFIEKSGLKSFAKIGIVKVFNNSPKAVIGEATLCKETMDVRIPFKRSAESM